MLVSRRRMPPRSFLLALALLLFAVRAAAQERVAFDVAEFGGVRALAAELYQPSGSGPFAAVVLLHDCDGLTLHHRRWAQRLQSWGYVTLLVDSFGYRRITEVCSRPLDRYGKIWARDAKGARDFLATRMFVSPVRIAVIGWGYGGLGAIELARADPPRLRAAAAFYPPCGWRPPDRFSLPLLILVGSADEWTPAADCQALAERGPIAPEVVVYPGAHHGFDLGRPEGKLFGHLVRTDPAAEADALEQVRRFLEERLRLTETDPEPPAPQDTR